MDKTGRMTSGMVVSLNSHVNCPSGVAQTSQVSSRSPPTGTGSECGQGSARHIGGSEKMMDININIHLQRGYPYINIQILLYKL